MKLSWRHEPTNKAHLEISEFVCSAVTRYGLTYPELIAILADEIQSWTKFEIRDERKK